MVKMNILASIPAVITCILSLTALQSCTSNRNYWVADPDETEILEPADWVIIPAENPLESGKPFHPNLRVIEYDEHGDKWESMQGAVATKFVRENAGPKTPVIVFIHGWRHNARSSDRDFKGFSQFLSSFERNQDYKGAVGIYIGWRGASVEESGALSAISTIPAILSFPNRRKATDNIADLPLLTDLWKVRAAAADQNASLIVVGHSFGARIAEHVCAPSIVTSHVLRLRDQSKVDEKDEGSQGGNLKLSGRSIRKDFVADLVILINPASESLFARKAKIALRQWPSIEPPAIISLTSESDGINRAAWPIGRSLSAILEPGIEATRQYRVGHHRLVSSTRTESQSSYVNSTAGFHLDRQVNGFIWNNENSDFEISRNTTKVGSPDLDKHGLNSRGYLVLQVSKDILHGHSGIPSQRNSDEAGGVFNPAMSKLITDLSTSAVASNFSTTRLSEELYPPR